MKTKYTYFCRRRFNMDENREVIPGLESAQPQPEPALETGQEAIPPKSRGAKKWAIIAGVLVVFLAAAAFFGARLLKSPMGLSSLGGEKFALGGGPGKGMVQMNGVKIDIKPAAELPQDKMSTAGLFVRRQDQSIFIGTGRITMMIKKGAGSSDAPESSGSYDGPVVEVVVDHQTKVYQDITEMTPPDASAAQGGTASIQQKVKEGSLDDLSTNSMVTVWGEKQGDRYIAKVMVFR
jgi:hypothetical protein